MRILENYSELPFEGILVGRDKIVEFFTDHANRLMQAIANGALFQKEETEFSMALAALSKSKTDTSVNLAQQGSETMNVDNIIQDFKNEITRLEPKVLIVFPKKSVEYHEFFPQGKSAYTNVTKGNIDNLFATVITACIQHSDKLGTEPAEVLKALRTNYQSARAAQLQKKGSTEGTRSAWDDKLEIVKDLAFHNLLVIIDAYRGQSDKIAMFFDQSIITPRRRSQPNGTTPETV